MLLQTIQWLILARSSVKQPALQGRKYNGWQKQYATPILPRVYASIAERLLLTAVG